MRVPVPTNKLVAFTLIGAVLTGAIAVGLAFPDLGLDRGSDVVSSDETSAGVVAADVPTPNPDFTPAVAQANGGGEEHREYEEYEDDEDESDDHDDEDEYREHEGDEEDDD
jgi:hypothetical protein